MRFDDRLKTVLDTPVADDRDRAVRWRQLVDLLSRARPDSDPALIDRALALAGSDRAMVPDEVRAATARSIAGRPLAPRLIAFFAADRLEVAAPLLAGATFDAETRAEVAAVASDEVRRFFFALEGLPLEAPPAASAPAEVPPSEPTASIGAVVARIEKLRREREPTPAVAKPRAAEPVLFRWESDAMGSIAWAEGAPRAALIGRALVGHGGEALLDEACRPLLSRRAPFVDLPLSPGEPFAGDWRVSGAPAFSPGEGRFIGYRGVARRIDAPPTALARAQPTRQPIRRPRGAESADSLRELVHEIKTPLNAIIGFAEIIDGQFLGPAHRNYRLRAAGIVTQARTLLSAVEDLDLAAKLQIGQGEGGEGARFAELFPPLAAKVESLAATRGATIRFVIDHDRHRCALPRDLAERLIGRLLMALAGLLEAGEEMLVEVEQSGGQCRIAMARPQMLAGLSEAALLDPAFAPAAPDGASEWLGIGFVLRVMRGLVRTVGGDLTVGAQQISLMLPALDA